jgi:putative transcriptional regulator
MKNKLREAREYYENKHPNERMSKAELARRVGVSRQTISLIESGDTVPKVDLAIRIARTLKIQRVDSIFILPTA